MRGILHVLGGPCFKECSLRQCAVASFFPFEFFFVRATSKVWFLYNKRATQLGTHVGKPRFQNKIPHGPNVLNRQVSGTPSRSLSLVHLLRSPARFVCLAGSGPGLKPRPRPPTFTEQAASHPFGRDLGARSWASEMLESCLV